MTMTPGGAATESSVLALNDKVGRARVARPAVIASGQSLSGPVEIGAGYFVMRFDMPAAWTAAALSFQVSTDGVTYRDVYDANGEVTIPSSLVAINRAIRINFPDFIHAGQFIKVRSGTSAAPVNQVSARTIDVVVG